MPICNSNGVTETGACPVNIDSGLLYANVFFTTLVVVRLILCSPAENSVEIVKPTICYRETHTFKLWYFLE